MKKIIVIILVLAMVLMIAGCSKGQSAAADTTEAEASSTSQEQPSEEPEEEPAGEPEEESSQDQREETMKIGMVVMTLQAEFFIALTDGMEQKFNDAGYEFAVASYDGDPNKAVSIVENYTIAGVDCIISMVQDASCDTALKDAMDKGIKVVTAGGESGYYDLCLKSDNADCGLKIAEMAADFINDKLGGEAKVAAFVSTVHPEMALRSDSMLENLKDLVPDVDIVSQFEMMGEVGEAAAAMENYLQQNPDIKVVVSYGDQGGLEAMEVIKAAGKATDDFGIFGCDATAQSLTSIAEGDIFRGTVYMGNLIDLVADNTLRLLDGDETLEKTVVSENVKVTADNIQDYLQ